MKTTKIAAWVMTGAVMATAFTSCKKDDGGATLPDIGGYQSSNDIASANLLAHFPFDGNNIERKSGATGTAVNATFTTGASGQRQALNLAAGYVAFPALAVLNAATSLPSFTVSSWVNVNNNGSTPSSFVTIARANEWAGSVNLLAETGQRKATSDTLNVKTLLVNKAADGNAFFKDNINSASVGGDQAFKGAGKWSHIVAVYNASTSKLTLYGNGKLISNTTYEKVEPVAGTGLGNLTLFPVTNVIIGAWGTNLPGGKPDSWQQPMTGQVDEVRIYNKALTDGEISSLYQLEQAGR